jgi:hypothetical protein
MDTPTRVIRWLFIVAFVLLCWAVFVACDESMITGPCLIGDVNGDGAVNVIDAQQIQRWSLGLDVAFPVGEPVTC